MSQYLLSRLIGLIIVLLSVSFITFALMYNTPGGPFDEENQPLSAEAKANIMAKYGLDQPFYVQWARYVGNAVRGDFGYSYAYPNERIVDLLWKYWKDSLVLGLASVAWSFPVGALLGVIAALKRNTWIDRLITVFSLIWVTLPLIALIFYGQMIFVVWLKAVPWGTGRSLTTQPWTFWILPVFLFGVGTVGSLARYTRAGMLEVLGQDYVRTARAKGLRPYAVIAKHAMRNMLIPLITLFAPTLTNAITGSVFVEFAFAIPGIGRFFVSSIFARDYPMIMATTLIGAFIVAVTFLISDILYTVVDPRVRLGGGKR
jgi:peptide/nickel transport system permease protein